MRLLLFACIGLTLMGKASGQFAPVGSRWDYSWTAHSYYNMPYSPFYEHFHYFATIDKDSIIGGKLFSKLTFHYGNSPTGYFEVHWLRKENNKVFYCEAGKENLLMDFNAQAGDSLDIDVRLFDGCTYRTKAYINSVSWVRNYSGPDSLKKLSICYVVDTLSLNTGFHYYWDNITEKILRDETSNSFFFIGRRYGIMFPSQDGTAIRCYTEPEYKFSSGWWDKYFAKALGFECDRDFGPHTGITATPFEPAEIKAWPNPFHHELNLQLPDETTAVRLYDAAGREVYAGELPRGAHTLQLSPVPGLCLLQCTDSKGVRTTRKLVVR